MARDLGDEGPVSSGLLPRAVLASVAAMAVGLGSALVATAAPPPPSLKVGASVVGLPNAGGVDCSSAKGRVPVLLVHGWNSDAGTWDKKLEILGSNARACLATFDYSRYHTEWVTNPHIGKALAARIAQLAKVSPNGKIIVVGHSMGGLAVRCAASPECGGDSKTASRLLDVVTMGTPNHGTWLKASGASVLSDVLLPLLTTGACAPLLSQFASVACPYLYGVVTSPAAYAFTPGSKQLTVLAPLPKSVPVYAIAGSVVAKTSYFGVQAVTLGNGGDLVVSQESAFAANRKVGTLGGTAEVDCGVLPVNNLTLIDPTVAATKTMHCWHGGEPGDDQFATLALKQINTAVKTVPATEARPDKFMNINGKWCQLGNKSDCFSIRLPVMASPGNAFYIYPDDQADGSPALLSFANIRRERGHCWVATLNSFPQAVGSDRITYCPAGVTDRGTAVSTVDRILLGQDVVPTEYVRSGAPVPGRDDVCLNPQGGMEKLGSTLSRAFAGYNHWSDAPNFEQVAKPAVEAMTARCGRSYSYDVLTRMNIVGGTWRAMTSYIK